MQAALIDANGQLTGLSAFGAFTLQESKTGSALAGAWTTSQSGETRVQLAVEAESTQTVELRRGTSSTTVRARTFYRHPWGGWLMLPISPIAVYAVYVDGVLWGYLTA